MEKLIIRALALYFRSLAVLAPRLAGRQAYWLFSRPRWRKAVPAKAVDVMARADRFDVRVEGLRVAAYAWAGEPTESGEPRPRVMLVHGWESRAGRLAVWVDPLLAAGFDVVAFDAPAHGESEGKTANPALVIEAMNAIVERNGPITAYVGHSLGGLAALLASCGCELVSSEGLSAERLVILAGAESGVDAMAMFCDIVGLGEGFLPLLLAGAGKEAGRPVADFDVHRHFPSRPVPTLWLHDPEDPEVPFKGAERVAALCPEVRLERVEGLGPHLIARDQNMIQRGLEFLADLPEQVNRTAA
ncbi:MAG: alpha/beta fold hydrolase [Acidobacteriota bacterium]